MLHQAIQRWSKPTLPVAKVPQVTTPAPTHTRKRPILRPMRRPTKDQPQDLLPRVIIHKPNAYPSTPQLPSTNNTYEPVAQHTRSRFPHTVDPTPPRVNKSTDIGPIFRRTRSQTTATANVISTFQVAKRRYPDQFLQSLAMPILDKN